MKAQIIATFALIIMGLVECSSLSLPAQAINAVLSEYFASNVSRVDLVNFGTSNASSARVIDEILQIKPENVTIRVLSDWNEKPRKYRLDFPSVCLFDSPQNFKVALSFIQWNSNPERHHKHLVHFPNATIGDIEKNSVDGFEIDNVDFLMHENEKSIDLVSTFMFTDVKCRSKQLQMINKFSRHSMTWNNSEFYPEKYQNLFGCPLTMVSGFDQMFPSLVPNISKVLADKLNFKLEFLEEDESSRGAILQNESYDLLNAIRVHGADERFSVSVVLISMELTFAVPSGEPYTDLERMFMMFQWEVWAAIASTLVVGLATIQIINFMSKKIQNFVFGRTIKTPTLNLIQTFLCGNPGKVPGRNFARFLLILFIIWCLIIRTCYQSKLFEFLQADLRRPVVQTVEELYNSNLTCIHDETGLPPMLNHSNIRKVKKYNQQYSIKTQPMKKPCR